MPYPIQTFATFDLLLAYIDSVWVYNGNQEIDGGEGNAVVNGLLTFIRQSPLNWQKAQIINSVGAVVPTRPVVVFMTATPASLTWVDNIYNEYVFINTTAGDIPLLAGTVYYDIDLVVQTKISAKSIVNIVKANNDLWVVGSVPSAGSGIVLPPFIGIVDGGGVDDPVSGTSIFQSNKLIGLGAANAGRVQIIMDEITQSNFGQNATFTFDMVTGTIDIDNGIGNTFQTDSSLYIDLNQRSTTPLP